MQFSVEIEGLDKLKDSLSPKHLKIAMARTLNEMTTASRTEVSKLIKQTYTLPAKRIKEGIVITGKAAQTKLEAEIAFVGRPPGLQHYKTRGLETVRKKGKYISVEIKKGHQKIKRRAFTISGKIGIFERGIYQGGRFIPLKEKKIARLLGPSIRGMFNKIGGITIIQRILNEKMSKRFWDNYNYQILKKKSGSFLRGRAFR